VPFPRRLMEYRGRDRCTTTWRRDPRDKYRTGELAVIHAFSRPSRFGQRASQCTSAEVDPSCAAAIRVTSGVHSGSSSM
jgi:hypothetical protein